MKMNNNINQIGISFFGRVMASISHEMKNRVAIIKEHAGLLKDYSAMAEQGRKIDMERLGRLGKALTEQVVKADDILKNMNQIAHSTDEIFGQVDLKELVKLVIDLAKRPANLYCIELVFQTSEFPITITTSPFFMMNLIWLCLEEMFKLVESKGIIELKLESQNGNGALIRMIINSEITKTDANVINDNLLHLSLALQTAIEWQSADQTLLLQVPVNITGS
jgi:signal transduction histidine kinase